MYPCISNHTLCCINSTIHGLSFDLFINLVIKEFIIIAYLYNAKKFNVRII